VLADSRALVMGFVSAGEAVEIAGLGPVPVPVVKEWMDDAYLRLIVADGIDIRAVSRATRYIDPNQEAALRARGRECCVADCDVTWRLQRDHRVPFAQGGPTALDNLDWYCPFHHLLKTKGWKRVGGPGCYRLVPPQSTVADTDDRAGERAPP